MYEVARANNLFNFYPKWNDERKSSQNWAIFILLT
jgi:hypothetical protein